MLFLARILSLAISIATFGVVRAITDDMDMIAWAISTGAALLAYLILHALLVRPLLKRAAKRASKKIIKHYARGGNIAGAARIARRLGLGKDAATAVAEEHQDALVRAVANHVIDEARRMYVKSRDRKEIRKYLRKQGLKESTIDDVIERIAGE